jgi:hypothetical protein
MRERVSGRISETEKGKKKSTLEKGRVECISIKKNTYKHKSKIETDPSARFQFVLSEGDWKETLLNKQKLN